MLRIVLATALLFGCLESSMGLEPVGDVIPLRPEITQPFLDNPLLDRDEWTRLVVASSEMWNNGLELRGCLVRFVVTNGVGAYPVTLWASDEYPGPPETVGVMQSGDLARGRIDVTSRAPFSEKNLSMLLHEMGHAIGLEHVDRSVHSIMPHSVPDLLAPTTRDLSAIECP